MRIIALLLKLASPLNPGFSITIANPPWQDLVIRDMQRKGPHRLPTVSVAHCYEHQGQPLRGPEMFFEAESGNKGFVLIPYCLGDESTGSQQHSVYLEEGQIRVNYQLQVEHMNFARSWNKCLEQQGFLAAFQRSRFIAQLWQAFDRQLSSDSSGGAAHLKSIFDQAVSAAVAKTLPVS